MGDLELGTLETPEEEAELGTLTIDDVPPVIELLGNGTMDSHLSSGDNSTSNWTIMVHHITTVDTWQDPGFIAIDDTFGDLTRIVEVTGPKNIDFTVPTDPDDPYVFEYRVKDAMGNEGIAKRELHISCPESAVLCEEPKLFGVAGNATKRSCGLLGACNLNPAFMLGGAKPETMPEGEEQEPLLNLAMAKPEPDTTLPDPPIIELLGPSLVFLAQGADYFACTAASPPKEVCDRGALAYSTAEGDLTHKVLACSPPDLQLKELRSEDHLFDSHGIAPCGIDTTIPGNWSITFTVQSRQNPLVVANVTRSLIIPSSCDVGERLCPDSVKCSKQLVCSNGILGSVSFDDVLAYQDSSRVDPLQLALIGADMVEVRQGSSYLPCEPGEVQSGECEPGAVIVGGSSTDSRLAVLALAGSFPARSCLYQSCLGAQFSSRGLSGTGLNTSAPVGTQFTIQFAAVDTAALDVVTASRTIFISHPCENKQHFLCDDGTCSPVECAFRDSILDQQPPSLSLRGSASLVVHYGAASLPGIASLLPCQTISSLGCGAFASDSRGNDISSSVRIREVTTCSPNATSEGYYCPSCGPSQQGSGMCLPGQYKYRYEVTDSDGIYAFQDRLVLVTETGDVQMTLLLASSSIASSSGGSEFVPSYEQIEELGKALTQQGSLSSVAFIGAVHAVDDRAALQLAPFGLDAPRVLRADARVEAGGRPVLEVKVVASILAVDDSDKDDSTEATGRMRRLLSGESQEPKSFLEALGAVQTILGDSISNGQFQEALLATEGSELESLELQSDRCSTSALRTSPSVREDLGMLVSNISSVQRSVSMLIDTLQEGGLLEAVRTALAMPPHLEAPDKFMGSYTDSVTEYLSALSLVEDTMLQAMLQDDLAESLNGALGDTAAKMEEAVAHTAQKIRFLQESLEFLGDGLSGAEQSSSCRTVADPDNRGAFRVSFTTLQANEDEASGAQGSKSERWVCLVSFVLRVGMFWGYVWVGVWGGWYGVDGLGGWLGVGG